MMDDMGEMCTRDIPFVPRVPERNPDWYTYHVALIDIVNETGGHGLEDSVVGRVNRIALHAIGGRDIHQAEAMMTEAAEAAKENEQ